MKKIITIVILFVLVAVGLYFIIVADNDETNKTSASADQVLKIYEASTDSWTGSLNLKKSKNDDYEYLIEVSSLKTQEELMLTNDDSVGILISLGNDPFGGSYPVEVIAQDDSTLKILVDATGKDTLENKSISIEMEVNGNIEVIKLN